MTTHDQDCFRVFIGREMYDQVVSGDMMPDELTTIRNQVDRDPLFWYLQQLLNTTGHSVNLQMLEYKVCRDADALWAEHDPSALLKLLTTMSPSHELNEIQEAFAIRIGEFGNTLDKGRPLIGQPLLIKGTQFMVGACFPATLKEAIGLGRLLHPGTPPLDGLIARLYCTEEGNVPLSSGIKIQNANHLHPHKDTDPVILGWFSGQGRLSAYAETISQIKGSDIFPEKRSGWIQISEPIPLAAFADALANEKNALTIPVRVALGWQRFDLGQSKETQIWG